MDKQDIFQQVLTRLQDQCSTMQQAAQSSHDAATGSESKSEGKYDTRGLEASYLASAQAEQYENLKQAIHNLNGFIVSNGGEISHVQPGNIVEVESGGYIQHYFLLPSGGGVPLDYEGQDIITVTPDTPVYKAILGCNKGDLVEEQDLVILDIL